METRNETIVFANGVTMTIRAYQDLRFDVRAEIGNLETLIRQAEPARAEQVIGAAIFHARGVMEELEASLRVFTDRSDAAMREAVRRAALARKILDAAMRS